MCFGYFPPSQPVSNEPIALTSDYSKGFGAEHRVLATDRQIRRQMCGQEYEIKTTNEISSRHNQKRPVPHRLAENLAHGGRCHPVHRHTVCAARPERGWQHRDRHQREKQCPNLPWLARKQPLSDERHHKSTKRSGGGDKTEHCAPPLH